MVLVRIVVRGRVRWCGVGLVLCFGEYSCVYFNFSRLKSGDCQAPIFSSRGASTHLALARATMGWLKLGGNPSRAVLCRAVGAAQTRQEGSARPLLRIAAVNAVLPSGHSPGVLDGPVRSKDAESPIFESIEAQFLPDLKFGASLRIVVSLGLIGFVS